VTRAATVNIQSELSRPRASARAVLAGGAEVAVPLEGLIDFDQDGSVAPRAGKVAS